MSQSEIWVRVRYGEILFMSRLIYFHEPEASENTA